MILAILFISTPLFPLFVSFILGFFVQKLRSDMLALFVSLSLFLILSFIQRRFGFQEDLNLSIFPDTEPSNAVLVLCVLSAISMHLIFPFIFARWGIELSDRLRRRWYPIERQSSKGNLVLYIMIITIFASSFAQVGPMMIKSFNEIQENTRVDNRTEKQ